MLLTISVKYSCREVERKELGEDDQDWGVRLKHIESPELSTPSPDKKKSPEMSEFERTPYKLSPKRERTEVRHSDLVLEFVGEGSEM